MVPRSLVLRKKRTFGVLLILLCLYIAGLTFIDADQFVAWLGVENGYLLLFAFALIGGASWFTAGSYYALVVTLAAGGLDPLALALVAGVGATFGDTFWFYVGRTGSTALTDTPIADRIKRLTNWLDGHPAWVTPVVVYLYASFTPLPNDLLAIGLGLTNRRYATTVGALVLGNMTSTLLFAALGERLLG